MWQVLPNHRKRRSPESKGTFKLEAVLAHFWEHRNVRIRVVHVRPSPDQKPHQFHRRRFAHVVDIFLVGDSKNQDPAAVDRQTSKPLSRAVEIAAAEIRSI